MTTKVLSPTELQEFVRKTLKLDTKTPPTSADATFNAGFRAGVEASRNFGRARKGQRSLDQGGLDNYVPGSGIDVPVDAPAEMMGDRAGKFFKARNVHAARTAGLNRVSEVQGPGGSGRTAARKAAAGALDRSSLVAISGRAIATKAARTSIVESVFNAVTAAGAAGVNHGKLCAGLGISEEELNLALATLREQNRITIER